MKAIVVMMTHKKCKKCDNVVTLFAVTVVRTTVSLVFNLCEVFFEVQGDFRKSDFKMQKSEIR